ncbi:MAG: hypothetical protein QXL70_01365 [Metallosphaera sp.]
MPYTLKWLRNYSDLVFILATDVIVFNELIFNGYIGFLDMETQPPFVPLNFPLNLLTGISNQPPIFSIALNPGLNLVEFVFYSLFKNFGTNLFYFFYLAMYSIGVWYLVRTFTENKFLAVLSTLMAIFNAGVLFDVEDSPTTLYVAPIPWFLAFYLRYRLNGDKKNLIYSFAPLTVLGIYGPPIPALMLSLISVEFYVWYRAKGAFKVRESVISMSLVLLTFTLFHINTLYLVLTRGKEYLAITNMVSNYFSSSYFIHNFNLIDIILMYITALHSNPFGNSLMLWFPQGTYLIYNSILVLFVALLTLVLVMKREVFPIFFLGLLIALASYETNYLGLFSLIRSTITVFAGVDPTEYSPLVGLALAVGIANIGGLKGALKIVGRILILLSLFLIIVGGIVLGLNFSIIWHPIKVPQDYVDAYNALYDRPGELVLVIPPALRFGMPFYDYNGSLANPNIMTPPVSFFYFSKGDQIVATVGDYNDYTKFYYCLLNQNVSEAENLSSYLDIGKVLIVKNPISPVGYIFFYNFGKMNFTSFVFDLEADAFFYPSNYSNVPGNVTFNNSNFMVITFNQNKDFSFNLTWFGLEVYPHGTNKVVLPYPGEFVIDKDYNAEAVNGTLVISSKSHLSTFIIYSNYVIANLISVAIISTYYALLLLIEVKRRIKRSLLEPFVKRVN